MIGKMVAVVVAAVFAASGSVMAQDQVQVVEVPALSLSPKLHAALVAEMAGVREGVARISVSLAAGEWGATARLAERIRDSYIMKQKLTRAELDELEQAVPADFADMDSEFHRHAEGLARATSERNYELAVFYLSKMMEGCGACHARYATHRFDGFKQAGPAKAAH